MQRKIPLFSLLGFKVGVDLSWFILLVLVTWSLAMGVFPYYYPNLAEAVYWWMGVIGALGLFFSIVFHEFCHSLVARHYGLPMEGITLFVFGGVAEMHEEPNSPFSEFMIAIVGPISSVVLALIFWAVARLGGQWKWNIPAIAVFNYLRWLNFILAGFNMIPAFPLDGGRVLRSIIWKIKGNLQWATRLASGLGSLFGLLLAGWGIFIFIYGNFITGLWYFLIGLFIRRASEVSYQQVVIRKILSGEPIRRFMNSNLITVPANETISALIENYIYKYHYKMFPVTQNGWPVGAVTIREIKEVNPNKRDTITIGEIAKPCSEENSVSPNTDAMEALSLMRRSGNSRLIVLDHGNLVGIVTLKDLLDFLALKIDLDKKPDKPKNAKTS